MLTQPLQNIDGWKDQMKAYQTKRTATNWGDTQPRPQFVKHADIKHRDVKYNPILQQYNDKQFQQNLRQTEYDHKLYNLAKNKDRALRYQQTFNVINFEDKLKGMQHFDEYPKEKPWYFRPEPDSKAEYNILSNIPLQQHHYAAPDKRPKLIQKIEREKKTTTTGLRDYNIINNRYLENHDVKNKVDFEVQRAQAAIKYWRTHDFNPLNSEYFDPKKEEAFKEQRAAQAKIHGHDQVERLPVSVKNQGMLYNPVNMKIQDSKRLYERDLREKNKKKRYQVRYDMELEYHERNAINQQRDKKMKINKISNNRFEDERKRGFHILTNDPLSGPKASKTMYNPNTKQKASAWDRIVANSQYDSNRLPSGNSNVMATIQNNRVKSKQIAKRANSVAQQQNSRRSFASHGQQIVNNQQQQVDQDIKNSRHLTSQKPPSHSIKSQKIENQGVDSIAPNSSKRSSKASQIINLHKEQSVIASRRMDSRKSEMSRKSMSVHSNKISQMGAPVQKMPPSQKSHLSHLHHSISHANSQKKSEAAPQSKAASVKSRESGAVGSCRSSAIGSRSIRTGGFQTIHEAKAVFF